MQCENEVLEGTLGIEAGQIITPQIGTKFSAPYGRGAEGSSKPWVSAFGQIHTRTRIAPQIGGPIGPHRHPLGGHEFAHATDEAYHQHNSDKADQELCSHNPILPKLLKKLIGKKNFKELAQELNPGEAWVLHHRDGEIIAVDWVEAPKT